MHTYKVMHFMAIDNGLAKPRITISLMSQPDRQGACRAWKEFPMEQWGEVRDIIGWASHAFLTAADQLNEDGWTIEHDSRCQDGQEEMPGA